MKYFTLLPLLKKVVLSVIPVLVVVGMYGVVPSSTTFAQFPNPPVLITVAKSGTGTGKVVSDKYGVNCGAECWISVDNPPLPLTLTLTATPDAGSVFKGWYRYFMVNGTTTALFVSSSTSQVFSTDIIDACFNICVRAQFDKASTTYALTVTKSGTGAGTVTSNPAGITCGATCTKSFNSGTAVVLTATPNATSTFAGWSGACSGTSTCKVTMSVAKSVTATFVAKPTGACPTGSTLSGTSWVSKFPTSASLSDLTSPFKEHATSFVGALRAAGATVTISATYRPPERAYLMHYAFVIAKQGFDPQKVPGKTGVNICWTHKNTNGSFDLAKSKQAALDMVNAYGITSTVAPSLTSRHTERNAVDMSISWAGTLRVRNDSGVFVSIASTPRTGMNTTLWSVGSSYGVIKFGTYAGGNPANDVPHWSTDGH
jgi:hypothetical protein